MQIDEEQALKDLVSTGIKIPPQPRVLIELNEQLISGQFDVHSLSRIISQDPGIAAMLFKVVRSPVFGSGRNFDSLDKILMLIGVKQTFNLVRAIAASASITSPSRKAAYETFWERSRDVAQLAALIAEERVSVCNVFPDQAYLAGIFHDCGVPLLMQRFPDYCKAVELEDPRYGAALAEEDARFNVDHSVVGYLVARHWNLPDFICSAIRYHHEPPPDEAGAVITLVAILQLAIHFHHHQMRSDDPPWTLLRDPVMTELGLAFEDDHEYFDQITERLQHH